MRDLSQLEVLFVAGFGPLVEDFEASNKLYVETLGLPLEPQDDNPTYLHSDKVPGVRHFALWPLAQAAQSCFGSDRWPADVPRPQSWIEFEAKDIALATDVLRKRGYRLLVEARMEPWGQTVTRLLGPEGILVGVTHTPWLRPSEIETK